MTQDERQACHEIYKATLAMYAMFPGGPVGNMSKGLREVHEQVDALVRVARVRGRIGFNGELLGETAQELAIRELNT